jgi:hypothetical protein
MDAKPMPKVPSVNEPNGHGFWILGERATLLSHIPMFMPPHLEQVFLEVRLTAAAGATDPATAILEDRRAKGDAQYVLASDLIILANLAPGSAQPLTAFTGKIYRGYPFDDIAHTPVVVAAVNVEVCRVILYRSLIGVKPPAHLAYFGFSTAEGNYLAHVVSSPPDFDQLLAFQAHGHPLEKCVELQIPGVPNTIDARLEPGWSGRATEPSGREVEIRVGEQWIYDAKELATAKTGM